jgi:hypothetical protein
MTPTWQLTIFAIGAALGLSAAATPASACTASGRFYITSPGPWPIYLVVSQGEVCDRTFSLGFPGTHLYIVSNVSHGRLSLRQGGHYTYAPAAGYRGADAFTLKLCGRAQGGPTESCANLNVSVAVQ